MHLFGTELRRSYIQASPYCLVGVNYLAKPDGTKPTFNVYKSDFLAFSLIIYRIIRVRKNALGHKFATILDTVAEDSTWYFLLVFSAHFTLVMTLNLARVSATVSHSGPRLILPASDLCSRQSNFFQPRELSRSYLENDPPLISLLSTTISGILV